MPKPTLTPEELDGTSEALCVLDGRVEHVMFSLRPGGDATAARLQLDDAYVVALLLFARDVAMIAQNLGDHARAIERDAINAAYARRDAAPSYSAQSVAGAVRCLLTAAAELSDDATTDAEPEPES